MQDKIKARLFGDLNPDEWDLPPKPKRMRWATYKRLEARFDDQEHVKTRSSWASWSGCSGATHGSSFSKEISNGEPREVPRRSANRNAPIDLPPGCPHRNRPIDSGGWDLRRRTVAQGHVARAVRATLQGDAQADGVSRVRHTASLGRVGDDMESRRRAGVDIGVQRAPSAPRAAVPCTLTTRGLPRRRGCAKARGRRIGIGIERRKVDRSAARPKAGGRDLMAVGLARDVVGQAGMPPGCSGAVRPEKRVTARSKLPQKRCTGLTLPR